MRRYSPLLTLLFAASLWLPVKSTSLESPTLLPAGQAAPRSPDFTGCEVFEVDPVNAAFEAQVVSLVNQARAEQNLPPFKREARLDGAARYHAADMGQDTYFDHNSFDRVNGNLIQACSTWDRIVPYYTPPDWLAMAENIAAGYNTPDQVVEGWMDSPGHRDNILSEDTWEIGVGYAEGGGGSGIYWVQDFGRRSEIYPLVINHEAVETAGQDVTIYIYGSWDEMRLRNDDESWGDWQPFQNEFEWRLGSGNGEHTVWAELRSTGRSTTSSDSILLSGESAPAATLGDLPDEVRFVYSIADQKLVPATFEITPVNSADGSPMEWTARHAEDWLLVSPGEGRTPLPIVLSPDQFNRQKQNLYQDTLTVKVVDPDQAAGSPQEVKIVLEVVRDHFYQVYLPQTIR